MNRPTRYFGDDGKTPRPALFDTEAQEEAREWCKPSTKDPRKPRIPSAQLRRFFGQVMADRRQFELKGAAARDEEAQVAMALLKAGAAYAAAREKDRKPLAEFAAHHADLVKTVAQFRAFARHFEAVVAWHKVFEAGLDIDGRGTTAAAEPRAGGQAAGNAPRAAPAPGGGPRPPMPGPRPGGGGNQRRR
jgi:CRISPR-associated protein Csm2